MPSFNTEKFTPRTQWARGHLAQSVISKYTKHEKFVNDSLISKGLPIEIPGAKEGVPFFGDKDEQTLLPPPLNIPPVDGIPREPRQTPYKVAIIGAGAAGLFTGMLFDWLNANCSLNVQYEILEANNDPVPNTNRDYGRVGGRLFTWNEWQKDYPGPIPNEPLYYDVGAMRYPDNPIMQRTFDLFKNLGMTKEELTGHNAPGDLVPYYMTNRVNPKDPESAAEEYWCFNDITKFGDLTDLWIKDPFELLKHGQEISDEVRKSPPDRVIQKAIEAFRDALKSNHKYAWKFMMSYDMCSTRSFLEGNYRPPGPTDGFKPPKDLQYNFDTVEYLEAFNGGTGWYDQALSETVLESLDFDWNGQPKEPTDPKPPPTDWRCIYGGSGVLASRMEDKLTTKPTYGKRVTRIDLNKESGKLSILTHDSTTMSDYDGVFSSTTMRCLKMIDTSRLGLNYGVKQAMRSLDYGPSAKVGILFDKAWWRDPNILNKPIKSGGLGHSDLNIRTCVYPSYNTLSPDGSGKHVLLCSYTWQQDAERIGSLMSCLNDPSTIPIEQREKIVKDEAQLKDLILHDLARLHAPGFPGGDVDKLHAIIADSYIDHYAHDWTHDPNYAGAFAFFKPGQFSQLWPRLLHPSNDFIIIGEVASPHHAWVVGALESAVVGVFHWLVGRAPTDPRAARAKDYMKNGDGKDENRCFSGLPDWMDENTAEWIGLLAATRKESMLGEKKGPAGEK